MSEDRHKADEVTEEQAGRYARRRHLMALAHLLAGLAFLLVMLFWGTKPLAALVEGAVSGTLLQTSLYALLFLLLYQLLIFPLDYYTGFLLEHEFGLSRQTFPAWLWHKAKQAALSIVLLVLMVEFIYWVLRRAPEHWWVYAGLGWLAVTVILSRILPTVILPIFYRTQPIDDRQVSDRLRRLAEEAGLGLSGVFTFNLSKDTRKANAALVGWGKTRRVLLGDTLIQHFTPAEVEAIFAHEVGHHVNLDIWKETLLGGVAAMFGFALCQQVMNVLAPSLGLEVAEVVSLPLLALVLMVFALLLLPLQNGYSRRLERGCDIYAVRHTSEPRALLTAFAKLARLNLVQRRPHRLIELLLYSHPPIEKRMTYVARELVRIEGIRPSGRGPAPDEAGGDEK
ncbi:MAG: M48 family metalloprotease [Planctomycetes bacterium]|nr:M48 family metalloprotease [Planctomycetota bacterium]